MWIRHGRHIECFVVLFTFTLALVHIVNAAVLTEVLVNSDTTQVSELPNMDYNSTSSRMIAVWDKYESPSSVWFQILDQDMFKIGENSLASDDLYDAIHGDVAIAATGDFAITYKGQLLSSDSTYVYVRFFNADGNPKGSSIQIADNDIVVSQGEPAIASDSLGNIVVIWTDKRNADHRDVWAQLFSYSGTKIGTNIRISDDLDTCCIGYPKVSMNSLGQFIITWHANSGSYGSKDIRYQLFQANGSQVGSIGTANSSTSDDTRRKEPAVSMNSSGSFCVAWIANIEDALYVQFYNSTGDPIGNNVNIQRATVIDETTISLTDSDVAVLAWEEWSAGPSDQRVYYQMFQSFTLSGGTEIVIDSSRCSPSVSTSSQDVYFLYEASDWRVIAAKLSDVATDVQEIDMPIMPDDYKLGQNYPNPFNPSTRIEFALPRAGHVDIRVFNVLGQQVATLVNEPLTAGRKVVTWNGTNDGGTPVASGVYFCQIKVDGFTESKKMILLK